MKTFIPFEIFRGPKRGNRNGSSSRISLHLLAQLIYEISKIEGVPLQGIQVAVADLDHITGFHEVGMYEVDFDRDGFRKVDAPLACKEGISIVYSLGDMSDETTDYFIGQCEALVRLLDEIVGVYILKTHCVFQKIIYMQKAERKVVGI